MQMHKLEEEEKKKDLGEDSWCPGGDSNQMSPNMNIDH